MQLKPIKFKILDEQTCSQIHKEALKILQDVGFRVYSDKIRKLLAKAGAKVDDNSEMVYLPAELIEEAVKATPSKFVMIDLDGNSIPQSKATVYKAVSTYVEAIQWLDYGADKLRPSTLADLNRSLKVANATNLVNVTGPIVTPMDVESGRELHESLFSVLSMTRKSFTFGIQNLEQAKLIIESLSVAGPNRDPGDIIGKFVSSPTSPLTLDRDTGEAMMHYIGRGVVALIAPCPMAGATSQISIIGTALQQVVENLFMTTVVYSIKPGTPALWGGAGAAMDMKTADVSYGGIERSLMMLANIDMAMYYDIPAHSPAGSMDSCLIDSQAGAEMTWTYFTRLLSNAAAGISVGGVTNGKAVSAEKMVIDCDIIENIIRFTEGIETDHLSQAAKEIAEVGPGGNFMMAPATMELLQEGKEYFYPETFNRAGTNAASMLERAHEKVEKIVSEYKSPVPENIVQDLEKLLKPKCSV